MRDNRELWDRRADQAERHPFLGLLYWGAGITAVILVITALVGVATTGSVFFQSAASNATLKSRENVQRNSTENAVTSIAFFHDQCNGVNAKLAIYRVNKDKALRLEKRAQSETDPLRRQQAVDQSDRSAADADGALNAAIAAANDYNAKASNSLKAKFRESGLPERINIPADNPASYTVDCG